MTEQAPSPTLRAVGEVPEGFVLVPIEPTEEMLSAFDSGLNAWLTEEADSHLSPADIYRAMIAAAPEPPQ